ncbi:MAG: D-alanyl-D-alanine carboxypeptidase, partial [Actinobacteria bacterium]|nr:D-alanyl-D-alanine carboxypeptidase [Actinomycetota bacterium]
DVRGRSGGGGFGLPGGFGRGGGGNLPGGHGRGGGGIRRAGGGGIGLIVVALILFFVFGINPMALLEGGGPVVTGPGEVRQERPVGGQQASDEAREFVATVLAETLRSAGIEVTGKVRRDRTIRRKRLGGANAGDGWKVVAIHETPLPAVLNRLNKDSMNVYAESLCKRLGFESTGGRDAGSWQNGTAAMGAFLKNTLGIPESEFRFDDGCGLSKKNGVSPNAICQVLTHEFHGDNADLFRTSLAVAGVDLPDPASTAFTKLGLSLPNQVTGEERAAQARENAVRDFIAGIPPEDRRGCAFGQQVAELASGKELPAEAKKKCAEARRAERGKDGEKHKDGESAGAQDRAGNADKRDSFGSETSKRAQGQGEASPEQRRAFGPETAAERARDRGANTGDSRRPDGSGRPGAESRPDTAGPPVGVTPGRSDSANPPAGNGGGRPEVVGSPEGADPPTGVGRSRP